ncbi:hypothetical protein ABQF08_22015 [Xanthomonas campestris pv. campestris]|uniref:hypothetical protein n=1 Tax=Xanthomonas campestris TaxID=339 RepID=UPI00114D215F|nr:hypothetical protein [Xanthomonas campestris]MCC3256524.1 hypothetical protein [Xanthomonas campestris pv. armoraciae]MCF8792769.1 hypothetical protein [Xanthomonas campestris pv. campestris]MCF8874118.1 hypothetical protein [Xanthomonas campestris pv. campestris]MCF8874264.1 hypothetical protein [Xanthomonas campestris pv. campestris]MEA0659881.1 hypothetical protein [Xanthomonas campestris pv. campestris]
MEREENFRLTLQSMTADECLAFLKACGHSLYNCKWHMRHKFEEENTHLVECNLPDGNLAGAREAIGEASARIGVDSSRWQLLPARL